MRVSDVYPPRGDIYTRFDQMDQFRKRYSRLIHDYYKDKNYFELPCSTLRFTPMKFNDKPITRANRVIFYYMATIRNYNLSRVWFTPDQVLDFKFFLLNDELDAFSVMNENGLFDTKIRSTYHRYDEYERIWHRYSMTPYINSQVLDIGISRINDMDFAEPYDLIDKIKFPKGTEIASSDRFYYDTYKDKIFYPAYNNELTNIYDYLFELTKVSVEAEGKFFRNVRRTRSTRPHNMYIKELGEYFVQRMAALMILSSLGMDISKISKNLVRITGDNYNLLMKNLVTDDQYLYRWSNQAYDTYEILYVIPESNYVKNSSE